MASSITNLRNTVLRIRRFNTNAPSPNTPVLIATTSPDCVFAEVRPGGVTTSGAAAMVVAIGNSINNSVGFTGISFNANPGGMTGSTPVFRVPPNAEIYGYWATLSGTPAGKFNTVIVEYGA